MTQLQFKGNTKEYFKIWIVNIFLTIITLGIYSAWAKVRTNRYFYSNTFIGNDAFEYTADPVKILKGRVLVVLLYLPFVIFSQTIIGAVFLLLLLIMIPWIVNKAVKFKLKNTKFRNINLRHKLYAGSYYKFFIIHLLLNIVTLYLAFPYTYHKFKSLILNNSSYGKSDFLYEGKAKRFYLFFGIIVLFMVFVWLGIVLIGAISTAFNPQTVAIVASIVPFVGIFLIYFLIFVVKGIFDALTTNYIWENTTLDNSVKFKAEWKGMKLGWIYFSNLLVMILSLGLLTPWAKIRLAKYKVENFYIDVEDLDRFIADDTPDETALGDASEDIFDIDIGI